MCCCCLHIKKPSRSRLYPVPPSVSTSISVLILSLNTVNFRGHKLTVWCNQSITRFVVFFLRVLLYTRGQRGLRPSLGVRNSRGQGGGRSRSRRRAEVARRLQRAEVRGRSRRGGAERGRDGGRTDRTTSVHGQAVRDGSPPQDPWPSGAEGIFSVKFFRIGPPRAIRSR